MSMTLGRCAIAEDPYEGMRVRGDVISFETELGSTTVNEMDARHLQLTGLVNNPDEPVVPFTWTEDANFDGFYRVRDLDLEWNAVTLATGAARLRVELEKIAGGFGRAQFETILQQILRTNDHGITAGRRINYSYFAPTGYGWADIDTGSVNNGGALVTAWEDGNLAANYVTTGGSLFPLAYWRAFLKPADFYKGSVRLEVQFGSTWYPIHGRQVPAGLGGNWRISNGIARIYPTAVSGNGRFTIQRYKTGGGGSWVGKEHWIGIRDTVGGTYTPQEATGDVNGFSTPIVLVNTPTLVVVRTVRAGVTYDFSLRDGDSWIEITQTGISASLSHAMGLSTVEGTTAFAGGIRATANDADGNRYIQAAPRTVTTDVANSRFYVTTDTYSTMTFQAAADYRDNPTGTTMTDLNTRDLFLHIRNESRRVVTR